MDIPHVAFWFVYPYLNIYYTDDSHRKQLIIGDFPAEEVG